MPDFEAIGDAMTGAVAARALEPGAGEADGHTHERNCLNCGCELVGDYCHCCGQKAHVHRTLGGFFHDLVHGVFHFEGKIWRTLPMLAWRPGELTRRYIDGERARFVSPIALFLFCVFLTFAVMSLTGGLDTMANEAAGDEFQSELSDARDKVKDLEQDRAEALREGRSTAKIESRLAEARREMTAIEGVDAVRTGKANAADLKIDGAPGWVGNALTKARKNPELLFYKLKTNAYKFSWALIPISVPFVWLLFPFSRRFRLYDHTIFVTYSLCFMMLLLVTGSALGLVLPTLAAFAWFVPPVHMYRQLRGAYGVGRAGAAWRTVALTLFAFMAIGLFASLLVTIGAMD